MVKNLNDMKDQDPDNRDRLASQNDDASANQFGTGYDGVDPDSQKSDDRTNQFGTGYAGTPPSTSDDANQFGTGYAGTPPSTDNRANQFGLGYGGVDDSVIEDPYGDRADEQDLDDLYVDVER
ncbi:hypothetical protein [Phormidesmis priestleyi]|nr:hypothetical protein [Phormidesmis priestleyi]